MRTVAAFSYHDREKLISIIQDLTKKKEYKQETLHLAGNLADRYLSIVLPQGKPLPNLFALGATVMLMAAKLEQPISPSFNRMLALLPSSEQARISKKDLIDLEERILLTLNFSMHAAGPIPFIERFQRLFGIDQETLDHDFKQVGFTARQFVKYMQRYGQFLQWKPSQLAAAAIVLSINLNLSKVGPSVGLKALRGDQVQRLVQGTLPVNVIAELTGAVKQAQKQTPYIKTSINSDPLSIWTNKIAELTGLDSHRDFAEIYTALMNHLDTHQFKGQLRSDSNIWIKESSISSTVSGSAARKDAFMISQSSSANSTDTDRMIEEEMGQ